MKECVYKFAKFFSRNLKSRNVRIISSDGPDIKMKWKTVENFFFASDVSIKTRNSTHAKNIGQKNAQNLLSVNRFS